MYKRKEIEGMIKNVMTVEDFIRNAKRYISAIDEGRVIVDIRNVSNSGNYRTMKFLECSKREAGLYSYYNFFGLFKALGHPSKNGSDYFGISGGGMDMVFDTNYRNIYNLYFLGFLSKKRRDSLCQKTPAVI